MKQQVDAILRVSITADAAKGTEEYERMFRHTTVRAFGDRPMLFECNSVKILSLREEGEIYSGETVAVRPAGEANFYEFFKDGKWLGSIQMNGELTAEKQLALVSLMAEGMNA